ncbi:MAG: cell division protein FtsZ [Chloroflexi bacterium]|nr:cell division protein FtsZ [Chloroflexota bacterium]
MESAQQAGPIGLVEIRVIGVGGGGGNAVARMLNEQVRGVEYIMANTDAVALGRAQNVTTVRIGDKLTRGLGAGGNAQKGAAAADESRTVLMEKLKGADLVFITAGMGGGTGTGAAPVVAQIAKDCGALTVGVVTTPFAFEGALRMATATSGIAALKDKVDTLVVINNERLNALSDKKTSMQEAFSMADAVVGRAILAIARIINEPGDINVDFADLRAIMTEAGTGMMAIGHGSGPSRTIDAARHAIANPLLDVSIAGARGVLFTVVGGPDLTLAEVNEAGQLVADEVDHEAQIFFGMHIDPALGKDVDFTMVATKIDGASKEAQEASPEYRRNWERPPADEDENLRVPAFLRRSHPGQANGRPSRTTSDWTKRR